MEIKNMHANYKAVSNRICNQRQLNPITHVQCVAEFTLNRVHTSKNALLHLAQICSCVKKCMHKIK